MVHSPERQTFLYSTKSRSIKSQICDGIQYCHRKKQNLKCHDAPPPPPPPLHTPLALLPQKQTVFFGVILIISTLHFSTTQFLYKLVTLYSTMTYICKFHCLKLQGRELPFVMTVSFFFFFFFLRKREPRCKNHVAK